MDVTHLHLHVHDRERSVAFYQRWFGLTLKRKGDGITFLQGDRDFLLALADEEQLGTMPPWFHFGVRVSSAGAVRSLLADLQQAGAPIAKPLYEEPGFASFRCADPDGYVIEVYWDGD